jgi:hypothetical protein
MNHDSYFSELLERESDAERVPFRAVSRGDWSPKKNDCHNNVDYWVMHYPEIKAVRGWLFWGPGEDARYHIMGHSVTDEAGVLLDITPIYENTPRDGLRFLLHVGTEDEFDVLKVPFAQFLDPFISFEEWRESQLPIQEEETDF